jgi:hypothetical protein
MMWGENSWTWCGMLSCERRPGQGLFSRCDTFLAAPVVVVGVGGELSRGPSKISGPRLWGGIFVAAS